MNVLSLVLIVLAGGALLVVYSLFQSMYWYSRRDGVFAKRGRLLDAETEKEPRPEHQTSVLSKPR